MKAIKFLALTAIVASVSAPASAERYGLAVTTARDKEVMTFGAWDNPSLRCQNGSKTASFRICNRTFYACESILTNARNAMVKHQGSFKVWYSDRAGYPRVC